MSDVKFEPWERLMLLDRQIEELSPSQRVVLEPFSAAALTVIRQMMGQKTVTEAQFAVERARQALEEARKGASARRKGVHANACRSCHADRERKRRRTRRIV